MTPIASSSRIRSATSSTVPASQLAAALLEHVLGAHVSASDGEKRADAVEDLRVVGADEARGHHGEAERRRIAAGVRAGAVEPLLSLAELVVRRTERVDLVCEARGERRETRLDGAPEDERRMRLLEGAWKRRLTFELVRRSRVVERVLGPGPDDDLDLLGEERESLLGVEEREAVREVLTLVPAGAHADVQAATGDVVDGGGHPREHARMAEGRRGDERAEPDPLGDGRQPGEGRPGVERVGVLTDDRRVVVGAEEPLEPVLLGEPSRGAPSRPRSRPPVPRSSGRRACQAVTRSAAGSVTGLWQTKRSQT